MLKSHQATENQIQRNLSHANILLLTKDFPWSVVPNLFCCGDPFHGKQFSHRSGERIISGWFKPVTFIVHFQFSSVQFSHSVMSDSLLPYGLKHARLPCPSPTPAAYSNSSPSHRWCHPTISSSVVPFSSCLQSLPASGSSPMSMFFVSGGQSSGASA